MSIYECPVCKKEFDVLWPRQWAYKKNSVYWCSWKCFQAHNEQKKEKLIMARTKNSPKMTKDMQQILIDLSINGGDYLGQLRAWGYTDPSGTMYKFRKKIEKEDPETYAKMQTIRKRSAEPAKKDPHVVELTEEEFAELSKQKSVTKTVKTDDFIVCCIRNHSFGELYRDDKFECIDWRSPNGEEVSMSMEAWKSFAADLPRALHLLGVDLHE